MFDEVLQVAQRAEAGRDLAVDGDPRSGVGLRPDGLPDIAWCSLPGGSFTLGSDPSFDPHASDNEFPQHQETVAAFEIVRYRVTVAQNEPFVREGGYRQRRYWTKHGWSWLPFRAREQEDYWGNPHWHIASHPVVGV